MKPADILRMIEEASPDDTGKLEEIDAHVFCFIHELGPLTYLEHRWSDNLRGVGVKFLFPDGTAGHECIRVKYTRSRDTLKSIRPEGCDFEMCPAMQSKHEATISFSWALADTGDYDSRCFRSKHLRTEELAELHAIIQCIAYERGGE